MKPFILVVLLCILCGHQPPCNYFCPEDFGVWLAPGPDGKRVIVIRSKYYVTEGKPEDKKAAELGLRFWHELNDQFLLLAVDSAGKTTGEIMPIRFDLKIFTCEDPLLTQKRNDSLGRNRLPGAVILNSFLLVDTIENEVKGCSVKHPNKSAGLTCGISYSRVKRKYKDNVKVIAHEIGHTLGLNDINHPEALMHEDTSGGTAVYEFEIRTMLDHAWDFRLNWYRNHFDAGIPAGKIVHVSGRDAAWPGLSAEFGKNEKQEIKKGKRK